MNVDLNQKITGVNKQPITGGDGKELTVKEALLIALMRPEENAGALSAEDAVKHRRLFDKIDESSGEVDLKAEDIVKLKAIAAKHLAAVVAGAVILALEKE